MEIDNPIEYLTKKFPYSEVFSSVEKDVICVRNTIGMSEFWNSSGQKILVPIYDTVRYLVAEISTKRILAGDNIQKLRSRKNLTIAVKLTN